MNENLKNKKAIMSVNYYLRYHTAKKKGDEK